MTIKRGMFLSYLLMLIIPTVCVAVVVKILTTLFTSYFLPDYFALHMPEAYENEFRSLFTNEYFVQFVTLAIITIAVVVFIVIAVSLFLTNKMMKRIMVPITHLFEGAQRIQKGDFSKDIPCNGTEELNKVCESFNDMQHELNAMIQKNIKYEEARNEMLAGISHDLRTPLTSIKSYVKGLQDGIAQTPAKEKSYLNIVYRNACDMEGLLNQLFLFSKLETGDQPFNFKPVNIQKYIITVLDSLDSSLQQHQSFLTLNSACSTEKVMLDGEQMKRVFSNILDNCLKHNPDRVLQITVTVFVQDEHVVIRIQDDGIGVSEQQVYCLFNSFYRGDKSRNSAMEGSGLGLSIARQIVEAHGGNITAENYNGLAIIVTLPTVGGE